MELALKLYGGVRYIDAPCPVNVRRLDHNALPLIHRMHQNGIRVDVPFLQSLEKKIAAKKSDIEYDLFQSIGVDYRDSVAGFHSPFNIGSPDMVARLLFDHLQVHKGTQLKMTKMGKRPTTEDQVLELIRDVHPAVNYVLDWREMDKLESTYVLPLQIVALRDPDRRIHTTFSGTTAATGRLSSSNPNLQNIPIKSELGKEVRKAFLASTGNVLVSNDLCLHPDTLVDTVHGPRPISSIAVGEKVLTLRGDYIKYGEITRSASIGFLPSYKLTFDNGRSVIASSEHKWPVNIRSWTGGKGWKVFTRKQKTTEELLIGEHMVPCKTGKGKDERETWYSKGARWYTKKHILIAEAVYGQRPKGHDVHHKDGNCKNNDPLNLEYKQRSQHRSDHSKENYKKQDHTLRLERLREGLKERRPYLGGANPNAKLKDGDWKDILELRLSGCSSSWLAEQYGVTVGHIRNLIRKQKNDARLQNHILIKKEFLGFQPMYAITVEPDHNYVLSCGVVTCNSQIEMRWAAHRSKDPAMMEVFNLELDIHDRTACAIFHRNLALVTEVKKKVKLGVASEAEEKFYKHFVQFERLPSKNLGFGVLYGETPQGLMIHIQQYKDPTWTPVERKEFMDAWVLESCEKLVVQWFEEYSFIKQMMEEEFRRVRRWGMCWDAFGRVRLVPEVYSAHKRIRAEGERKAGNHCIQSSAQGTIKLAMAEVLPVADMFNSGGGCVCWPLLQIHDELIHELDRGQAKDFAECTSEIMEKATPLVIPVRSSSDIAERWGDLK